MINNKAEAMTEEEIALFDAIERAITNVRAALAEIDQDWVRVMADRPTPSAGMLAALDTADEVLAVAREDLARARASLAEYVQSKGER